MFDQNIDILSKFDADLSYDRHDHYQIILNLIGQSDIIVPSIVTSRIFEDPDIPLSYRDKHVKYIQGKRRF